MLIDAFLFALAAMSWLFLIVMAVGHHGLSPIARTREKHGYV